MTPEHELHVFAVAGELAADRRFTDDEAAQCLLNCLRIVGLEVEEATATVRGEALIAVFMAAFMEGDAPPTHDRVTIS